MLDCPQHVQPHLLGLTQAALVKKGDVRVDSEDVACISAA